MVSARRIVPTERRLPLASNVLVIRTRIQILTGIRWRPTEPQILFVLLFTVYFVAACYLTLVANVIYGDAWSRVEIAYRILSSRDPHLAAIGFIWGPLPEIPLLPLVALKALWPQLVTSSLAGGIVSSLCMAGGAVQLRGFVADAGLSRPFVWMLTAAFALNPVILMYGANGMSEAMLLLFLLSATRSLARWLRDDSLNSLILTGVFLALAYLTRYESLGAAASVTAAVALVSYVRVRRAGGQLWAVANDVLLVAAPWAFAFVVWAAASWIITGQPFEQLTSGYGNSAQVGSIYVNRTRVPTGYTAWSWTLVRLMLSQLLLLAPALPLVPLYKVGRLSRSAISLAVAAVACIGGAVAFIVAAQVAGELAHPLRYLIGVVPLAVALAGACIAANQSRQHQEGRRAAAGLSVACALTLFVALPTSAFAMLDATTDPWSFTSNRSIVSSAPDNALGGHLNWSNERKIAADLDAMHLPKGAVLVDDFLGFPIVVSSGDPTQFVITSDRDFETVVADPKGLGVRYILVPVPDVLGSLDAINRQYPGFYASGGGFASLVNEYPATGVNDTTFRLFRIN